MSRRAEATDGGSAVRSAGVNHRDWHSKLARASGGREGAAPTPYALLADDIREAHLLFPDMEWTDSDLLDGWIAEVRTSPLDQAAIWILDEAAVPRYGGVALARGFRWGWQPHWMSLNEADYKRSTRSSSFEIREIRDNVDWQISDLPEYTGASGRRISTLTSSPQTVWYFAAMEDGDIVGHAYLNVDETRSAGLYDCGVVPAARNRGIGRALTSAACSKAFQLRCPIVTLNATAMGEPVYRAAGFQSQGRGQTWWASAAWFESPPAPSVVAFVEAIADGTVATVPHEVSDLDAPLPCGLSAIEVAAILRRSDSAEFLVAAGATLDVVSCWDLGWQDRADALLRSTPSLANLKRGEFGATPLHVAAQRGDTALARLLLSARPDMEVKDSHFGQTALQWADHLGRDEIAALIRATR